VVSAIPVGATLSDGTNSFTAFGGHQQVDIHSWNYSTLTVTPANGTSFTLTVTATETETDGDVSAAPATATEQVNVTPKVGYLWGTTVLPTSGVHEFSPLSNVNTGINTGVLIFGTSPSSGFNGSGPDVVTENAALFDPFVLPYRSGIQTVQSSSTYFPFKYQAIMPVVASAPEALVFYSTEPANGGPSAIYQQTISEPNGPNGTLSVGSASPLESDISGQIVSLYDGYTTINPDLTTSPSGMTSYDIAWATFNSSTGSYQENFQIFSPAGSNLSSVVTIQSGPATATTVPAWQFRNAGGLSDAGNSVPYAAVFAVADPTNANLTDVRFQGYNVDGSPDTNINFLIKPDLTAFPTATASTITAPSTGASLLYTPNGTANSGFSVAWSEAVTDGTGTHFQVEFAMFKGSGQLISQTAYQVPDAQNIRVASFNNNGNSAEYLVYGDTSSTTVIEFDAGGHQIASITDNRAAAYGDFAVLGDGRIALTYALTSQYTTDIFDLRLGNLNLDLQANPSLSNPNGNYIAGTHFTDTVKGANGVNNFYEFIGSPATGTPNPTPSDHFTGGNGFNEALFTDARSNFTISLNAATVQSTDAAHGGTLDISNVQALAFGVSHDASPSSTGGLEVTNGETLVMLGNFASGQTYPVTIDVGGTLEIMAPSSAEAATFNGAAMLQLDASQSYTGTVSGFGLTDVMDLTDVTYASNEYAVWTQTATTGGGTGTLQIYNGSGALQSTLHLNGIYGQNQFALTDDGTASHGTDVNFNYISFASGTINHGGNYPPQVSNAGSSLQLTDGNAIEAGSWFANSAVSINGFTASFDYHATGNGPADGMAFILQDSSAGVHALGGDGGLLGYGGPGIRGGTAISPSVAVEFNLYAENPSGPGTAFATDGATGTYTSTGSVAFASGDAIQAVISYDGSHLTETLTDLVNGAVYTTSEAINIASVLGANTAYVGFSAATGGGASTQTVSNFAFEAGPPVVTIAASATVNFDGLDASGGAIDGTALNSYLAAYGITLSASGSGADVAIEDDRAIYGGGIVNASSGHNLIGESGGHPVSYTATFAHALTSFAFDRVQENAGPSGSAYPQWSATAYDAAGHVLSTVGESAQSFFPGNYGPATHYVLSGPAIDHVVFSGDDAGFAGFANVLTDNWVLDGTTALVTNENTPLAVNGISVADAAAGTAQIEVTLAAAHGVLTLTNTTGLDTVVHNGFSSVELFGSQSAIDTALANGVIYNPTSNYSGTDTLTVTANDQGHNGSSDAQTTTQQLALTISPTNDDAPVIGTDQLQVSGGGGVNAPTTVTGLYVTDPGAGSLENFSLTAITAGAGSGTSVTPSSGSGHLSDINSDLSSITYTPGSTPPGTDMITFTVAGQSASDTVHFVFNQGGTGPGAVLTGTTGKDVIFATGNQDTLTGGGGQDQFVFAPTSSGSAVQHTITDFDVNLDKLDVRQFSAITASHLPTESQQGADTLVTLDTNDTILLKNVVATNLHTSDFIIHV
jgi:hypothetical protein